MLRFLQRFARFLQFFDFRSRRIRRIAQTSDTVVLRFDHHFGGGSEYIASEWIAAHRKSCVIFQINPHRKPNKAYRIELACYVGDEVTRFYFLTITQLLVVFYGLTLHEIIIGQLAGYKEFDDVLATIVALKTRHKTPMQFYLQDFYVEI